MAAAVVADDGWAFGGVLLDLEDVGVLVLM